jgi:hypothetical protein
MRARVLATALTVLALVVTAAWSGEVGSDGTARMQATAVGPGCDTAFPVRVSDPGFPPDLVVCGDTQPQTRYRVANDTESVWTIRTAVNGVSMLSAGPVGSPAARVLAGPCRASPRAAPCRTRSGGSSNPVRARS